MSKSPLYAVVYEDTAKSNIEAISSMFSLEDPKVFTILSDYMY